MEKENITLQNVIDVLERGQSLLEKYNLSQKQFGGGRQYDAAIFLDNSIYELEQGQDREF